VIEMSHAIAGPHCAQILADHGADVIKVEPPGGERGRTAPPFIGEDSLYFASHNRGKRSLCLDVKHPDGLAVLLRLCDNADVVITNFSADVPSRLGWSYETLAKRNPRLVFAHVTGFGSTGEHSEVRAYDGVIQSMSGIPDLTGPIDRSPVLAANFPADHIAAYQAAMAILMALVGRAAHGAGAYLDVAMFDAYFATASTDIGEALAGTPRIRTGNKVLTGFQDVFETADGAVFMAPLGDVAWARFCPAIGHADWLESISYDDSLGQKREELDRAVGEWALAHSTDEILKTMLDAGVACGPVRTISQAVEAAAESSRNLITTVKGPCGTPLKVPSAPVHFGLAEHARSRVVPALGADSLTILGELGYASEETRALGDAMVIRAAS
jgi:crotonobetainyl-CoA:carnitine CoA-transferase CaiB-like acyl-CoA transferase